MPKFLHLVTVGRSLAVPARWTAPSSLARQHRPRSCRPIPQHSLHHTARCFCVPFYHVQPGWCGSTLSTYCLCGARSILQCLFSLVLYFGKRFVGFRRPTCGEWYQARAPSETCGSMCGQSVLQPRHVLLCLIALACALRCGSMPSPVCCTGSTANNHTPRVHVHHLVNIHVSVTFCPWRMESFSFAKPYPSVHPPHRDHLPDLPTTYLIHT